MNAKSINNTDIQVMQKRDLLKLLESFRDDEYIAITFMDCGTEHPCTLSLLGIQRRSPAHGATIMLQVGL